jgi:GLPGLI family protein
MRFFLLLSFVLLSWLHQPQGPILIGEGDIKFERKEKLDQADGSAEFRILHFVLRFNRQKAVYYPDKTNALTPPGLPGEDNVIFDDLSAHTCLRQRNVLGDLFLFERPIPEITWKITSEKRTIMGFECRRANALILDSIYAVAFYTEDIIPPIGPESFSGLPGMILGVVLPHKHMSWFATSIEPREIPDKDIVAPSKGTRKTTPELKELIQARLGSMDPHLNNYLYLYLL